MSIRAVESAVVAAIEAQQRKLAEQVFGKRRALAHDEYVRLNGEWWGLEDAKAKVREATKAADI